MDNSYFLLHLFIVKSSLGIFWLLLNFHQAQAAASQSKDEISHHQSKGPKQQKKGKKHDKQKQQSTPPQHKVDPKIGGKKAEKTAAASKDEKPSVAKSDAGEQPQKTKAELKAERRAIQVNMFAVTVLVYPGCQR